MIHEITCNDPRFKTLKFHPGLNLLVVERNRLSTDHDSCNRAGKSCFIKLVHFLLGLNLPKNTNIFLKEPLKDFSFNMVFSLKNEQFKIERSGSELLNKSQCLTLEGPIPNLLRTKFIGDTIEIKSWHKYLIAQLFSLKSNVIEEYLGNNFIDASFIMSYFLRQEHSGGFSREPYKSCSSSSYYKCQAAMCLFLGLDLDATVKILDKASKYASKISSLGANIKLHNSAIKLSDINQYILKSEEILLSYEKQRTAQQSTEEYLNLQMQGARLAKEIEDLRLEDQLDHEYKLKLESNKNHPQDYPSYQEIKEVYEEADIYLPDIVKKRFDEYEEFYNSVISNRSGQIDPQLEEITKRITERGKILQDKKEQLRVIHEKLETLSPQALSNNIAEKHAELKLLKKFAKQYETIEKEFPEETRQVKDYIENHIKERKERLDHARNIFSDFFYELYEEPAKFDILATSKGLHFNIWTGSIGKGTANMITFCFDMMLMVLGNENPQAKWGPGFLIHDSHIFDSVDKRQIAKALKLGASLSEQYGFQYIVTLNSETLPADEPDLQEYRVNVDLNDNPETGGLFGMRFEA